MVYKFVLISNEVDDFMREISIDSEAKFIDLHEAIISSVNYTKDGITSFYLCNDNWEKEKEVSLIEIETSMDEDSYTMDETVLSELIDDEGQKLRYIFDNITERSFFMELKEIVPGEDLDEPECTASVGLPPEQYMLEDFSDLTKPSKKVNDDIIDESFYGDESFNDDEIDLDGYGDLSFDNDMDDYSR